MKGWITGQTNVVWTSALLAIGGCSSYTGVKLDDKPTTTIKPNGVPYSLSRAEYTLTRTPPAEGQKKPTYILGVTYEPDPKQQFTLRINPGFFADPTFSVKLAAGGVMQGTSASVSEQLTSTITALGSFGANLVGALATGVFDKDSVRRVIADTFSNANPCKENSDVDYLDLEGKKPVTVGAVLNAR